MVLSIHPNIQKTKIKRNVLFKKQIDYRGEHTYKNHFVYYYSLLKKKTYFYKIIYRLSIDFIIFIILYKLKFIK